MRLLYFEKGFQFIDFDDDKAPPYAILSHTWSENNDEEVTYQDLRQGTTKNLLKLQLCKDWAHAAGYKYFWIDTCCIDKRNDAELAYAIRSMYRWYAQAGICFVYLSDLTKSKRKASDSHTASWKESLKSCRWFTRGWTLQELVASKNVEFYARDGHLGSKQDLLPLLMSITGIDLCGPLPGHQTRLSWIAKRQTKRPEDKAYCMLGICGVMMSPQYGEGEDEACRRLETAIVQRYGTIALENDRGAHSEQEHRQTILDLLRFDAMESRRTTISAAMKKTCRWILTHDICLRWLRSEHSFFWIKGKPGAGKSVMVKFLDEHITKTMRNAVRLSFYFTARGEQLEKTFAGMYRSLLVQLLDAVPELQHVLDSIKYSRALDIPQLQSALTAGIQKLQRPVYFFIDAIDECHDKDIQEMIDYFENLQDGLTGISVCFASRHYPVYEIPTRLQLVLEDTAEHTADLDHFVKTNLRLGKATPKRREEIQTEIVAKANGVFLWTVLVVKILQKEVSAGRLHAVQGRLRDIPAGLKELFQDILRRDQDNMDEFILCLRWILYAKRPLKLPEFYFAMMAGLPSQDLEWVPDELTEDQMHSFLLTSSKGFAECTRGKKPTTQFIHESVRDFLIKDNGFDLVCGESVEPLECYAHEQLKQCCSKGLSFDIPPYPLENNKPSLLLSEKERQSLMTRHPFAEYATTHILYHADRAAVSLSQRQFLASEFELSHWTTKSNALQRFKVNVYNQIPSFSYLCAERDLATLMPRPCNALSQEEQRYFTPLIAAFMSSSWQAAHTLLVDNGATNADRMIAEARLPHAKYETSRTLSSVPWRWAVRNGLEYLSEHLLSSVPVAQLTGDNTKHALILAVESGNVPIGKYLRLLHPTLLSEPVDLYKPLMHQRSAFIGDLISPLDFAAFLGQDDFVVDFVDAHAYTSKYINQALCWTIMGAHEELSQKFEKTAQILIDAGADVNADVLELHSRPGANMLQRAIYSGAKPKVIQFLLTKGADATARAGFNGSALQAAALMCREEIVQMLLDAGADVNAQAGYYGNALQAASHDGNKPIVQMLLNAGADVNAQGGYFGNALQAASHLCDEQRVRLLLAAGADVHAPGRWETTLEAARSSDKNEQLKSRVIQVLLDAGATDSTAQLHTDNHASISP
ncbi:hypothetical protein AMS68_007997 [Peltaster fructicola]|uniref:Uncharacterized protein n=1 Tax=Peltaster fructicola TaxID=286661 RepID=A0A6H0Y798_9PEZI|nr:hypothetical protein AMS68_007997 [Peltaster fructicola]